MDGHALREREARSALLCVSGLPVLDGVAARRLLTALILTSTNGMAGMSAGEASTAKHVLIFCLVGGLNMGAFSGLLWLV